MPTSIPAPIFQQALNNYAASIQTLQRLEEEESLAKGNSVESDVNEDLAHLVDEARDANYERTYGPPPSPLPCLLIRNKSHTFSVPSGLGVPRQLLHLEILGVSKAKTVGSESTWSDSGSTYFDGDDRHLDGDVASSGRGLI